MFARPDGRTDGQRRSDGQNIYCRCVINNVESARGRRDGGFGCVSERYRRHRNAEEIYTRIVRRAPTRPGQSGEGETGWGASY